MGLFRETSATTICVVTVVLVALNFQVTCCRLEAEQERLEKVGPLAFYSEWVEAWKKDTSREAVQKHFEETGEDENLQLIEMFTYQTDREYRIMMGTDTRIRRDPLAMRMREDQIKQSMCFCLFFLCVCGVCVCVHVDHIISMLHSRCIGYEHLLVSLFWLT